MPTLADLKRLSWLDVIFRLVIGGGFAYMIVAGLGMPETTFGRPGLYPIFVGIIGLTVWSALHLSLFFRALQKTGGAARIYDIAYEFEGIPEKVLRIRTLQVFGMLGALIIGIWLASFQIAVPLFLLFYLKVVGKTSWRIALLWTIFLELLIVVLFGNVAHVAWPRTPLERAIGPGFSFQKLLGDPIRKLLHI